MSGKSQMITQSTIIVVKTIGSEYYVWYYIPNKLQRL